MLVESQVKMSQCDFIKKQKKELEKEKKEEVEPVKEDKPAEEVLKP